MEIRTLSQGEQTLRVQEKLLIDSVEYNFGTVFEICYHLEDSSPDSTSRITADPVVRELLLTRKVLTHTDTYPPSHPWCRFYSGEGFESFWNDIHQAQEELRRREPLNNADPNLITNWLHGESWAIVSPTADVFGDGRHAFLAVHSDEELGHVYLTFDSHPEDGYWIVMTPAQGRLAGEALAQLVDIALNNGGKEERRVDSDTDALCFDWEPVRGTIGLSGTGWSVEEGTGTEMTPNEADEISWQLREQGISPRKNPRLPDVFGDSLDF